MMTQINNLGVYMQSTENRHLIRRVRKSVIAGIVLSVLYTVAMVAMMCLWGANIHSTDEVMGPIILISLIVNAIVGLLVGACLGEIQRALEPQKHNK